MTSKKSGRKATSGGEAKRGKSKAKRALKDLDVKNTKGIRGGVKSCAAGSHFQKAIITVT